MTPLVAAFQGLHLSGCFIVPNPWDCASARLFAGCGFKALASSSSAHAFVTNRKDGCRQVPRDEAIAHAASLSECTGLPVTFDAEDGLADSPDGVADTVLAAASAGLAGISIEDRDTGNPGRIRDFSEALERVQAAVEACRASGLVLAARAPGLADLQSIKALCAAVPKPVNHVLGQEAKGLSLAVLEEAGVRRISLGGVLTRAAFQRIAALGQEIASGSFQALDDASPWDALR